MNELIIYAERQEYEHLQAEFRNAGIDCKMDRKMGRGVSGGSDYLAVSAIAGSATVICSIILAVATRFQKRVYYRKKGNEVELEVLNYTAEQATKILKEAGKFVIKK